MPMAVLWLFEKLLKQQGDAQWIERDLARAANLIIRLIPNLDNSYEYSEEVKKYNQKYLVEESERKLTTQKRRHDYRHNLSKGDWAEAVVHFDFKCAYCGKREKITVDHFYPFSKGGLLTKNNIIPACSSCNSSKSNHLFEEWYKKQPFYDKHREKRILEFIEN